MIGVPFLFHLVPEHGGHVGVMQFVRHIRDMADGAVPVRSDRIGISLILDRLRVVPVFPIDIEGWIQCVSGSVAGAAHDSGVVGPVPVQFSPVSCPSIEYGVRFRGIEVLVAEQAVRFVDPGLSSVDSIDGIDRSRFQMPH